MDAWKGKRDSFVAKDAPLDDGQVRMVRAGTVEAEPDASTADAAIAGSGDSNFTFLLGRVTVRVGLESVGNETLPK
jgi:hypothetical protein